MGQEDDSVWAVELARGGIEDYSYVMVDAGGWLRCYRDPEGARRAATVYYPAHAVERVQRVPRATVETLRADEAANAGGVRA